MNLLSKKSYKDKEQMLIAESISLRVFAKFGENPQQVREKLLKLIPFDLEKEKIALNRKRTMGFNQEEITIFELKLKKKKHTNIFLELLKNNLSSESKNQLIETLEKRIDNECNFFLRLNKSKLIYNDQYELENFNGDCFHIKIDIAVFPKRKDNAIEEIRTFFAIK